MIVWVSCLAGGSVVLAVGAAFLLWWLSHARTSTKGWVGNPGQVDKHRLRRSMSQVVLALTKPRSTDAAERERKRAQIESRRGGP